MNNENKNEIKTTEDKVTSAEVVETIKSIGGAIIGIIAGIGTVITVLNQANDYNDKKLDRHIEREKKIRMYEKEKEKTNRKMKQKEGKK